MYQKSKSGMWHIIEDEMNGKNLPKCQSYNLDRPNYLIGEILTELSNIPGNAKKCKKCFGRNN